MRATNITIVDATGRSFTIPMSDLTEGATLATLAPEAQAPAVLCYIGAGEPVEPRDLTIDGRGGVTYTPPVATLQVHTEREPSVVYHEGLNRAQRRALKRRR